MFGPTGPDMDEFHRIYWRRRPLFVRGGLEHFLGFSIDWSRFDGIAAALRKVGPQDVKESGDGVVFLQNMDRVDAQLRSFAAMVGRRHGWPDPWFDGVKASKRSAGGIGCHYDDSDNFVIQQEGTKLWRLCPPNEIPDHELTRRILKDPSVGNFVMSDAPLEFRLEAGDILYIPIFWPHWGITVGDSLSISLVCNSSNLLRSVLPLLRSILAFDRVWWEPLPRLRNEDGAQAGVIAEESLVAPGDLFDVAWQRLTAPSTQSVLRERWLSVLKQRDAVRDVAPGEQADGKPRAPRALTRPQFDFPAPLPQSLAIALLDGSTTDTDRTVIADHRAAVMLAHLERLLLILQRPLRDDRSRSETIASLLEAIRTLTPETRRALGARPEIRLWIRRMHEALGFAYPPRIDAILEHLPLLLVPSLISGGWYPGQWRARARSSSSNAIHLLAAGSWARTREPQPEIVELRVAGAKLLLVAEAQREEEFVWSENGWTSRENVVEPLPLLFEASDRGPPICLGHRWLESFLPFAAPQAWTAPWPDVKPLREAAEIIARALPALMEDFACDVAFVAFGPAVPAVRSAEAARSGMALVSSPAERPNATLVARTLIEQYARTRFRIAAEACGISDELSPPPPAQLLSPLAADLEDGYAAFVGLSFWSAVNPYQEPADVDVAAIVERLQSRADNGATALAAAVLRLAEHR